MGCYQLPQLVSNRFIGFLLHLFIPPDLPQPFASMAERVQSMDQLVFANLDRFGPSQVEVFNRLMTASKRDPCQTLHSLIDKETM